MKRPLLRPALLFALGVAAGEWWAAPLGFLFGAAGAGLALAAGWERFRGALLLATALLAGWIHCRLHQGLPAPDDLRRLAGSDAVLATVRGEIRDTPSLRLVERNGQLYGRTVFRLCVDGWRQKGDWEPARGEVAVSLRGAPPRELFRTRRLELHGVLRRPPGPVAPGLFDYATHLRHQGCWFELQADGPHDWRLAEPAAVRPPLSERFLPWAQAMLARGLPDDEATRLLWAMTLGWKTALTDEVDAAFMRSGTMHVFAISGLHIALIAGVLVALLRAARIPRHWCGIIVVPVIWFYVAATGWQTSAIRSALMSTVVIGTWTFRRPGDLFNSLSLAFIVVLVWEPGQLFQASFQLSFGVVAGMALLVPALEPRVLRLLQFDPDPFLPADLRPRWQRWLELPLRRLALLLSASLAALIASLPLTVHYFHLLNPVSLLANVVVVPLSGLTLAAAVGSLLTGSWWPVAGETFNASAWLWMRAMTTVSRAAAEMPGGVWHVAPPPWPWWLAYYGTLVGVTTGWARREQVRIPFLAAVALTVAAAAGVAWESSRTASLTILPGGKATVVDARGRRDDLLIDTGNESVAGGIVVPFLHAQGWNSVPRLLVTHGDLQHVGGAPDLLAELPVKALALSSTNARSPAFRQLLALTAERGIERQPVTAGDRLSGWEVLHPAAGDRFPSADDNAVVLRRELNGVRVLLLSDLGRRGQAVLLARDVDLSADLVVAGVPRDGEPLPDPLLARISPRLIVVASAEYPAPERIRPATRERLLAVGPPVMFTESSGTIELRTTHDGVVVRGMDGSLRRLSAGPLRRE